MQIVASCPDLKLTIKLKIIYCIYIGIMLLITEVYLSTEISLGNKGQVPLSQC
jgi:hypothetical protein